MKFTRFGEAMGTNMNIVGALARLSRPGYAGIRRSASLRDIALEAGVGEAAVAIAMKYAVKQGFAEKSGPRSLQQTWIATKKADEYA